MKAKIRPLLEECIEYGISRGIEKAHKHTDEPTHAHIFEQIEWEIWSYIDERFDFERSLVDELIEGMDALKEKNT